MNRLTLVLIVCGSLCAQPQRKQTKKAAPPPTVPVAAPAPAKTEFPLESLRVTGNRQISADRIAAASGLKIGSAVQKADFDAAREKLVGTGAFANVGYEYKPSADGKGFDAVIEVAEANDLFPYRFEDFPAPEALLREAVGRVEPLFLDRIPATAPMLARYTSAVEEAVPGFQVTAKLNAEAPGELAVLFRPVSARPNIAEIRFVGNQAVPATVLLRTINDVAIGIPYTEPALRQRLDVGIRKVYEARGYLRVAFPTIATENAAKVDGLVVTVTVNEGPVYNLGTVRISGAPSPEVKGLDAAQLERLADFKKGPVANFDEIGEGLERVYKRLRNSGYLHATGSVTRDIHEDSHTVDVAAALNPGPRYSFGKLDISGLDIITEPAIRKMWGALEGKPFNPEFPESFLARVRDEGILDNLGKTRSQTHVDETSKSVGVTLYFNGAEPQPQNRGRDQPVAVPPPDIW